MVRKVDKGWYLIYLRYIFVFFDIVLGVVGMVLVVNLIVFFKICFLIGE